MTIRDLLSDEAIHAPDPHTVGIQAVIDRWILRAAITTVTAGVLTAAGVLAYRLITVIA